ncbi:hypothetical protein NDU88_001359 [Pleurodeles waltl]|uniref:PiggyBac transposable element-derived protein domain-containing protein n=1 Tax=Pleurodeles waltl TaxID=8319 RepID=A0AAV7L9G2_PLEWA|nr:hypothetical protein NDU88_001359 [Pleurodeles waltl]
MKAHQVVGVLFESSSDHDYETDSASEAEEEVQDSGSEFSVREESSDDEATLSADEGPVLEEDTDVPVVQQPAAERLAIGRPDTFPRELVCKKLEKGQSSALRNDELLALKFVDRRDVYMLTIIHDESTSPVAVRGQVAEVRKPVYILDYNKHMGGVDRVDQRMKPYTAARKSYVWYKKLVVHLFHLAIFNAFVVFKDTSPESRMAFVKFQESVIASLAVLEQARVPKEAVVQDEARLKDRHFAEHIPPTTQKIFLAEM